MQSLREQQIWALCRDVQIFVIILVWCFFSVSYGKLVFISEPQTQPVVRGGGFRLDCVAKDTLNKKITYKWLFNEEDLNATISDASFFQNNSIYISRITEEHLGKYTCTATIIDGSTTQSASSETAVIFLAYIRDFFISPTSISTNDTSNAIFTCVTGRSAPSPTVYWERNGVMFRDGSETTAVFGRAGADSSGQLSMLLEVPTDRVFDGKFACVATNPMSKESKKSQTADLTVEVLQKLPTVAVAPPTSLTAAANLPLEIRCVISGFPKPVTTWKQENGTKVTNSATITVANTGSLLFRPLEESDAGIYTCQGSNSLGTVSAKPSTLTVAVLSMEFRKHPSNTSAIAGRAVTLDCAAPYSIPPANVTWYKNNEIFRPRSGEYAATVLKTGDLYFSNVQMNDQGVYFCVAVNSFAEPRTRASQLATVVVTGAPQIVTPPIPTTVIKEGLLRMTCIVKGVPFPMVTWWKDGEKLVASQRISFRDQNQELWIARMTKLDHGQYSCKADNKYGSITSQPVLVDIVVPPQILQSVESRHVRSGSSTKLNCVIFGDPTPTILWLKDGYPLTRSAFVQVSRNQVYFPNIRAVDAGTYTCRATNKGGRKESSGRMTVLVKPSFHSGPKDVTVNGGTSVEMTCRGAGVPTPNITWSYNNTRTFPVGVTFSADKKKLLITKAKLEQIGIYKCTLQNEIGRATEEGKLIIQVPPTVQKISGRTITSQGSDLSLTCVAYGIPYPNITWYMNTKQLKPTTDKRVTFPQRNVILIKFVTTSSGGNYRCVAENILGKAEVQALVYVRDLPRPPILAIPKPLSVNSIKLTWRPVKQDTNNNVTFWVIQYRLSIAPDFQIYRNNIPVSFNAYEVANLKPATKYHFRMAGRNEVGIGEYTGVLSATTFETAPTAPRNLKVLSVDAWNVTLSWEKPSNLQAYDVTDYEVHYRRSDRIERFTVVQVNPVQPTQVHTVDDLHPNRPYQFKVRAATRENDVRLWGMFSETVSANMSMAEPTLPPQKVTTEVLSSTSISLSWQPIPEESENGPISHYRVRYKLTNIPGNKEITVASSETVVNITNLSPWRYYTFIVAGMNPIGHSPYSDHVVARTLPGVPTGSPQEVQLVALSSTSLSVSWKWFGAMEGILHQDSGVHDAG